MSHFDPVLMCVTKVSRQEGRGRVERYYSPGVFLLSFYPNEASGGKEMKKLDPEPEKRQTPQPPASSLASGTRPRPRKWMGSHHSRGSLWGL